LFLNAFKDRFLIEPGALRQAPRAPGQALNGFAREFFFNIEIALMPLKADMLVT